MLSIPKYPEQYAQHFPTIFYLLCCASQHHVWPLKMTGLSQNVKKSHLFVSFSAVLRSCGHFLSIFRHFLFDFCTLFGYRKWISL